MKKHSKGYALLQAIAWCGALCAGLTFYGLRENLLSPAIASVLIAGIVAGALSINWLRKAT